jgi:hypothetical protein
MTFDIRRCCQSRIQSIPVCDVTEVFNCQTDLVLANDISRSSFNIPRIRRTMAGAHEVLTAVALTRSRILISKAQGEYTNLRGSRNGTHEDDHQSILGSVMGVTQEVINRMMDAVACLILLPDAQSSPGGEANV